MIGIIAILIALLLPALSQANRAARRSVCGSNLQQLGSALASYANDNQGWYPRALPLVSKTDWEKPWPSTLCPMSWQAGYPAILAKHMGIRVQNPYDYLSLPKQMGDDYQRYFRCPDNTIPLESDLRKCGFPIDYGLHNRVSQNRATRVDRYKAFLAADMTWGLAYVPETKAHEEPELAGWWVAFVHREQTINVLSVDHAVETITKQEFIRRYAAHTPGDDPL